VSSDRHLLGDSARLHRPRREDEPPPRAVVEPGKRAALDDAADREEREERGGSEERAGAAAVTPGKQTRMDREGARSPADAIAYASWMLAQDRGPRLDRRAEPGGAELDEGALATAFGFLDEVRGGERLPAELARRLGEELGADLSDVRVHTGDHAARTAAALRARAVTVGPDIYFAAGAYDPASEAGIELIAHEVAHVVQNQRGGLAGGRRVSRPDDAHEQQADAFAARFVAEPAATTASGPTGTRLQRATRLAVEDVARLVRDRSATASGRAPGETPGPAWPQVSAALTGVVQRRAAMIMRRETAEAGGDLRDPDVEEALQRAGGGEPLPEPVRREMEAQFSSDFRRVRIHVDAVAARAAATLRANAFTLGEDIFFAEGAFTPQDATGRRLLVHELTHVVQAQQGRVPTGHHLEVSRPSDPLEREAAARADEVPPERAARPAPLSMSPPAARASGRIQRQDRDDGAQADALSNTWPFPGFSQAEIQAYIDDHTTGLAINLVSGLAILTITGDRRIELPLARLDPNGAGVLPILPVHASRQAALAAEPSFRDFRATGLIPVLFYRDGALIWPTLMNPQTMPRVMTVYPIALANARADAAATADAFTELLFWYIGARMIGGVRVSAGTPSGRLIIQAGRELSRDELIIAGRLVREGRTVTVLAESSAPGVRTADFLVDGVRTELKTIANLTSRDLSGALGRRILEGAGQGSHIIADVRGQAGMTRDLAYRAIRRAFGADTAQRIQQIRIIGEGFDVTMPRIP
jgi:hypothetical protein